MSSKQERIADLENEIAYRQNIVRTNRATGRPIKRATILKLNRHLAEHRRLTNTGGS